MSPKRMIVPAEPSARKNMGLVDIIHFMANHESGTKPLIWQMRKACPLVYCVWFWKMRSKMYNLQVMITAM